MCLTFWGIIRRTATRVVTLNYKPLVRRTYLNPNPHENDRLFSKSSRLPYQHDTYVACPLHVKEVQWKVVTVMSKCFEENCFFPYFTFYHYRWGELSKSGVRFVTKGQGTTFSQDLEPEYISYSSDETKAYICLQVIKWNCYFPSH